MSSIRADRIATLYFFGPLCRVAMADDARRIPILMYHSISDGDPDGRHPYYGTRTTPQVFEQHLKYLSDHRYTIISPDAAVAELSQKTTSDRKLASITF